MCFAFSCRKALVNVPVAMREDCVTECLAVCAAGETLPAMLVPPIPETPTAQWAWDLASAFQPLLQGMIANKAALLKRVIPPCFGGPVEMRECLPEELIFCVRWLLYTF